jgi:hypothetical protein
MSDERKKVMFLVGVESLDDHLTGRREAEQKQAESDSSEEG